MNLDEGKYNLNNIVMICSLESCDSKARVLLNSMLLDRGAAGAVRLGYKDSELILFIVEKTEAFYHTVEILLFLHTAVREMVDFMDKRTGRVNKP